MTIKMEKEFIPYELALKFKELGFNEECMGYYTVFLNGTVGFYQYNSETVEALTKPASVTFIKAPVWQQAFDFMAFKCSIHGNVITSGRDKIYMSSEYREGYGGSMSNGKVYTDIYQCRIDLLTDMIELFEEAHN